jgi:hypothetical protein
MAPATPRVPAPGHRLPLLSCLERCGRLTELQGRFMSRRASSRSRLPCPSAVILDSQSVQTTERGSCTQLPSIL